MACVRNVTASGTRPVHNAQSRPASSPHCGTFSKMQTSAL